MASSSMGRMLRRAFSFLYVDVAAQARETKRLTKRFTEPKLVLIYQGVRMPSVDWSRGGISVVTQDKPQMGARVVAMLETAAGGRIGQVAGKVVKITPKGFALDFEPLPLDIQSGLDAAIREKVKA
jgi:Tfp pilus assembly protein PilZ